jgi:hypothetical protein
MGSNTVVACVTSKLGRAGIEPPTRAGRRLCKQVVIEVEITRVTFRTVFYMALDKTFSGTLPQWQFLQDFRLVTERAGSGQITCPLDRWLPPQPAADYE